MKNPGLKISLGLIGLWIGIVLTPAVTAHDITYILMLGVMVLCAILILLSRKKIKPAHDERTAFIQHRANSFTFVAYCTAAGFALPVVYLIAVKAGSKTVSDAAVILSYNLLILMFLNSGIRYYFRRKYGDYEK